MQWFWQIGRLCLLYFTENYWSLRTTVKTTFVLGIVRKVLQIIWKLIIFILLSISSTPSYNDFYFFTVDIICSYWPALNGWKKKIAQRKFKITWRVLHTAMFEKYFRFIGWYWGHPILGIWKLYYCIKENLKSKLLIGI